MASIPHLFSPSSSPESASLSTCELSHPISPKPQKRVRLCSEAKCHDGLSKRTLLFHQLFEAFFGSQFQKVTDDYVLNLTKSNLTTLSQLRENILDLLLRIETSVLDGSRCGVPMIATGGGLPVKFTSDHVPFILMLDNVVQYAGLRLIATNEQES